MVNAIIVIKELFYKDETIFAKAIIDLLKIHLDSIRNDESATKEMKKYSHNIIG